MRLHALTVSAFGPFPGTEHVDFTEINEAGVFLLAGPTGAGKSSVLDAVCFALYGVVPGQRGVKALRSDHAPPGDRPLVELDLGLRGRRFVLRRSPEWTRSRTRGGGVTTVRASASIAEVVHGDEVLLSARAAEVGLLVGDLMGMTAAQFQQVAMLPQGGFATFLRASSQERHDVLQQLFHTRRFADIETWVAQRSSSLREEAAADEAEVRRLLHAVADRHGDEPPWSLEAELPQGEQLTAWAGTAAAGAAEGCSTAAAAAAAAVAERDAASAALHHADRTAAARLRWSAAAAVRDRVEVQRAEVERAVERLGADVRAARLVPVLRLLDEQQSEVERLRALAPTGAAADEVLGLAEAARLRVHEILALIPREAELRSATDRHEELLRQLEGLGRHDEADDARAEVLPRARQALTSRLTATEALASGRDECEARTVRATEVWTAAAAVPGAEAELRGLEDAARQARDAAAAAHESLLDLVRRRLEGMAAELAGRLVDGDACSVCGSTAHPAPAPAVADPVGPARQHAGEAAYRLRQEASDEASAVARAAADRLAALRHAAEDLSPGEALQRLTATRADLAAADAAAAQVPQLHGEADALAAEQAALGSRRAERAVQRATARQELTSTARACSVLAEELRGVLGAHEVSVASALDVARQHAAELSAQAGAWSRLQHAERHAVELRSHAEQAAAEAGFPGIAPARSALLATAERRRLSTAVDRWREEMAVAEAAMSDPEVRLAGSSPMPDLPAARDRQESAAARAEGACREAHLAEERAAALARHGTSLRQAVERWTPRRRQAGTAEAMSRLVRGTGADNRLQMRLSAYVLAARLDQVVGAANERLAHMRDHRFLLERTGEPARRNSQAGLGLRVLDLWTGDHRDPATLSGGETFVVSLALALGLADVVTVEAGGTEIETLFVDEGFGMLDSDTLDDVMDRLDGLRAGGRTVGVVSHVAELRARIPCQLHVEKRRDGSSLTVRNLVA